MKGQFKIEWHDSGREPQCAPNPNYPKGIDLNVAESAINSCVCQLPYPAKRCGTYLIECTTPVGMALDAPRRAGLMTRDQSKCRVISGTRGSEGNRRLETACPAACRIQFGVKPRPWRGEMPRVAIGAAE